MVIFLRRNAKKHSKFGKRRKKLLSWRKPKGRDNKMREKRRGYAPSVSIGYKQGEEVRGLLNEKKVFVITKILDLEKIGKNEIGFIGKVGKKRKIEILTKAKEKKIELKNFNAESFLKKEEKKSKLKKDSKVLKKKGDNKK